MKEIKIRTQKEYNQIGDQKTPIQIVIETEEKIIIEKIPKNCHVVARGSSHVVAWDSSHVVAGDSSHVVARGSSHVVAGDSSHVVAWDSSHVVAWDSSHVVARGSSHVVAWEWVTINKVSDNCKITIGGNAFVQDETKQPTFANVNEWLAWWNVECKKGKVIMYKAVTPELTDFYTGKIHYKIGSVVEAPDWDEKFNGECGYGLHCSPHLFLTQNYARPNHVHIRVEVDIQDIRIVESPRMPDKVRVKKLRVLEAITE